MKLPNCLVNRVVREFDSAELGDPRRKKRLKLVAAKLARRPKESLPGAVDNEAEVQGAYRLMNNERVSFEVLLGSHAEQTRRRAEQALRVLVVHDTTTCSFPRLDPRELGYLPTGKAGFLLHLALVMDAKNWRRPLGVIHAEPLFRPRRSTRGGRKRKVSGGETATWSDREYARWSRGMTASAEALHGCEQVIHLADREGDSYALMAELLALRQSFVIRVRVDRRARQVGSDDAAPWESVKQVAARCEGMMEREVPLSARKAKTAPGMNKAHHPRKARIARLRFSATRLEVPRPNYLRDPVPATLPLNLVQVIEYDPPAGQQAVEWLLYTTEPIDTEKQVAQIVDDYRTRWAIEEFNAALKTGCAYEEREFESRLALLTLLAISLPIACEVLWLRSRARSAPCTPAGEVLTALQIQILRTLGSRKLSANPTAEEVLFALAGLGGHLKGNGPPGCKILMRAMTNLLAYEKGWVAALAAAQGSQTCD
jgi:hypothetical protein